jgi:hypothetical protein
MAINIDDIQEVLIQNGIGPEKSSAIIKDIKEAADAEKEDKEKAPRQKSKFTVLVRGDAELAKVIQQAWIVQTPEEQDDSTLVDRLKIATAKHNNSLKKKKWAVELWRDVFAYIKSKTTKEQEVNVKIKTKEPVRVIVLETEKVIENDQQTNQA